MIVWWIGGLVIECEGSHNSEGKMIRNRSRNPLRLPPPGKMALSELTPLLTLDAPSYE
jgi:hypothetical protein